MHNTNIHRSLAGAKKKKAPFEAHSRECVYTRVRAHAHARATVGGTHPQPVSSAHGHKKTDAINSAQYSFPENTKREKNVKKPPCSATEALLVIQLYTHTHTHTRLSDRRFGFKE